MAAGIIPYGDRRLRLDTIEYHNRTSAPWVSTEVFLQGCFKNCPGCFNQGIRILRDGHLVTPDELFEDLKKHVPYKKVTFSGGEPFLQADVLWQLTRDLHQDGFFITCYSGYTAEEIPHLFDIAGTTLLENIDILVDGPFIQELLTPINEDFKFVGSSNQRIINVQKSLDSGYIVLWTDEDTKLVQERSTQNV